MPPEFFNMPQILMGAAGSSFFIFLLYLEYLKWSQEARTEDKPSAKEYRRLRQRFFPPLAGLGFFGLYLLGQTFSFLNDAPLYFSLYWAGTFAIGLTLFIFPARDLLEYWQGEARKNDRLMKEELTKLLFILLARESGTTQDADEEQQARRLSGITSADGSEKPPTLH